MEILGTIWSGSVADSFENN